MRLSTGIIFPVSPLAEAIATPKPRDSQSLTTPAASKAGWSWRPPRSTRSVWSKSNAQTQRPPPLLLPPLPPPLLSSSARRGAQPPQPPARAPPCCCGRGSGERRTTAALTGRARAGGAG